MPIEKEKFLGAPYPIFPHARGYLHTQSGLDQIKSDMLALLLTNKNERVMLPNYGVGLRKFLFEPADSNLENDIANAISEQLSAFEPRVVIDHIEVSTKSSADELNIDDTLENVGSILFIRVRFFDPMNIQEIQELVLEKPIANS